MKRYIEIVRNMNFKDLILSVNYMFIVPRIQILANHRFEKRSSFDSRLNRIKHLGALFKLGDIEQTDIKEELESCCQMYMEHRFDLLGSGWINNQYSDDALGVWGYKYPSLSLERDSDDTWLRQVVSEVDFKDVRNLYNSVTKGYIPIDWQKDYKSGYRWSAKEHSRPVKYIDADINPGVDIKVPWELSRLQHLTRIAYLYSISKKNDTFREKLMTEYKDQVVDFIAQNPPGRGVNWGCTMDVGIRTANMVISYSLMRAGGWEAEPTFEKIFGRSIYAHCRFIRQNLEWSSTCRSNHYLSDICGLLFGASILSECRDKRRWLRFATDEIKKEIMLQFRDDGSNFEASVGYHRLSSELAVYAIALIHRLSREGYCNDCDEKILRRIYRAGLFASDTVLPDGTFYQCGDNDSGRFVTITPIGTCRYETSGVKVFYEEVNRPDALISAVNALLDTDIPVVQDCPYEKMIIRMLCGDNGVVFSVPNVETMELLELTDDTDFEYHSEQMIDFETEIKDNYEYIEYPNFGMSIIKAEGFFLGICWSDNGQNGNAGHTHNDKLSYELWVGGKPIVRDPGTYVYTPLPNIRNEFRSVTAHSCIQTGEEQNRYINLFSMNNDTKCRIISRKIMDDIVELGYTLEYNNTKQARMFRLDRKGLTIENYCNKPFSTEYRKDLMTAGYGRLVSYGR